MFHCSREDGIWAVLLGGTARGNQWGKLAVRSASGREQTMCISFFALITLSRPHRYLLPCLPASSYCVDVTVVNFSFTDCGNAHPDPPGEHRPWGGRAGSEDTMERVSLAATLVLITTVVSLLALKVNIMPLTRHLFSIMSPRCCSVNKTCRRPLPYDSFLFSEHCPLLNAQGAATFSADFSKHKSLFTLLEKWLGFFVLF